MGIYVTKKLKLTLACILLLFFSIAVVILAKLYLDAKQKSVSVELMPVQQNIQQPIKVAPTVIPAAVESSTADLQALTASATAVAVSRDPQEGWLPIAALFDEHGLLKAEYYNLTPSNDDLNKLPFPLKKISDFKWRTQIYDHTKMQQNLPQYVDQCYEHCAVIKDTLIGYFEKISFHGDFILNDKLISVYAHGGSGAYMPISFTFIEIDVHGNVKVIQDQHDAVGPDQLARINQLGLDIDLRPYQKLHYFLYYGSNGLAVFGSDKKQNTDAKTCKEYYQSTLYACPMLYNCTAEVVVQDLARAYAGHVDFSFHDPNIDEKKFNQLCFKVCRQEKVSYEDFETALCRVK